MLCLSTWWGVGLVNTEMQRMLPVYSAGSTSHEMVISISVLSSGCCLAHSISLPLERFEVASAWEFPHFYPSAIIPPAASVHVTWISSVLWCCGYVWCEFSIRSMTTKKGLQKRRPITLSYGMLEAPWAVPAVWKAHEQCSTICWMVSLLGVNMVLLLSLLGTVLWFWGRVPGSLATGYIVLLSDLSGKKPDTIHRQNFMDSVMNGSYFRQTCANELYQPFPSVLCSWHSRSLWRCSACLHLSRSDTLHKYDFYLFKIFFGINTFLSVLL